jgi:hypothetical protein
MTKFVKIFLALILVFSLSGCLGSSTKNYVRKTEPRFNEVYAQADSYGEMLNNEAVLASQIVQNGTDLATKVKTAKLEVEAINPPQKAQILHTDLVEYYTKIAEVISKINHLYEFVNITEKISKNLEESSKSLPSDFSKDLSNVRLGFEQRKTDQQKSVDELKEKDFDQIYTKAKQSLIDMGTAYVNFLDSVITAIDVKNSNVIRERELQENLEKANGVFQSEMNTLQEKILSKEEEERFNALEENIKKEFNRLR